MNTALKNEIEQLKGDVVALTAEVASKDKVIGQLTTKVDDLTGTVSLQDAADNAAAADIAAFRNPTPVPAPAAVAVAPVAPVAPPVVPVAPPVPANSSAP